MSAKVKSTRGPKGTVAGPPWLTLEKLEGKQIGLNAKMGICLIPPTNLPKELYPAYVIDDANRPKVFDCHLLQLTGYLLWPQEDSQRLELHVEHNSIRIYSHRQITRYRTQHANITGQGLVSSLRGKGAPKARSRGGKVSAAIVRSIYHDVAAFSPTSNVPLPGAPPGISSPGNTPAKLSRDADLPLLPLSLDFSLRDLSQIWLDTTFRHVTYLAFQSGFAMGLLLSDAEALVHCITHKLRLLHIYCVKVDNMNKQALFRRALTLAKESREIRERIVNGVGARLCDGVGRDMGAGTATISADARVYLDPYDESSILSAVAQKLRARDRTQAARQQRKAPLVNLEDAERYGLVADSDDDDDDDLSSYDGLYLAMRRTERIALGIDTVDEEEEEEEEEDVADEDVEEVEEEEVCVGNSTHVP